MSEWAKSGNVWKHGKVLVGRNHDGTWTAWILGLPPKTANAPLDALWDLTCARHAIGDLEGCSAARRAWIAADNDDLEWGLGDIGTGAAISDAVGDLARRVANLEEALADALATIAELRREMRDMSEWKQDGRRWTFGAVTMVYDPDGDLPWSARFGATPSPRCLSALAALDTLEQCLVGERKHEAADEVRAARDTWIERAERDAASAQHANAHAFDRHNRESREIEILSSPEYRR